MAEAEEILDLCEHFHVLPSQLMRENAGLLRLLAIRAAGRASAQMAPVFEASDD